MNTEKSGSLSAESLGFLVLRGWLGLRALIAGIEKFAGAKTVTEPLLGADGLPDPSGALVEFDKKVYGFGYYHGVPETLQTSFASEPLLPEFITKPFYMALGPVLILLGLALLIGFKTRLTLFAQGILYMVLSAGLILIKQDAGVAWLAIHIGLIAFALYLEKYNRFTLGRQ